MVTYLLTLFDDMDSTESKRTFIIYNNFIKINKEIRTLASWVTAELKFKFHCDFYEVTPDILPVLKEICGTKMNSEAGLLDLKLEALALRDSESGSISSSVGNEALEHNYADDANDANDNFATCQDVDKDPRTAQKFLEEDKQDKVPNIEGRIAKLKSINFESNKDF